MRHATALNDLAVADSDAHEHAELVGDLIPIADPDRVTNTDADGFADADAAARDYTAAADRPRARPVLRGG